MSTTTTYNPLNRKPTVPLAQRIEQWRTIRDCLEGEDAIKERGEAYLPRPAGMRAKFNPQGDSIWTNYLGRASYYGVPGRTLEMLVGMVLRVNPIFDVPDSLRPMVDGDQPEGALSGEELAQWLLGEMLSVTRAGVLVDMDPEERTNNVPYIATYYAESILAWQWVKKSGMKRLVYVKLAEDITGEEEVFENYQLDERYRELALVDGVYTVTITNVYHHTNPNAPANERERLVTEVATPRFRGKPLDFIPFVLAPDLDNPKPAMLDLCRLSLAHYRNSADYEWALFMTAQPTPYVTGATDEDDLKLIGSGTIWKIREATAKVGMLEFQGAGLEAQRAAMQDKEQRMATLGAYLIRGNINRNESEETARMRNSGETSALRNAVNHAENTLRNAYRYMAIMAGADPMAVDVTLNRDFIESALSGKELLDYVKAWQQGGLDDDTYVGVLKSGELVDPARPTQEVITAIERTHDRRQERAQQRMAEQQRIQQQQQERGGVDPSESESGAEEGTVAA